MLKAKLDSIRKNKKGFSLVELIIVIAIMVALVAVMAPNFVKYVQKSRDTALQTAAEDYLSTVKTFYGDPDQVTYSYTPNATIVIKVVSGKLSITSTLDDDELAALAKAAGVDAEKSMGKTDNVYTITFNGTTAEPTFIMAKADS